MRSEYAKESELKHILAALTAENRLACEISLATGLRIGDVLTLKKSDIDGGNRFSVFEQKTGKSRRIFLNNSLLERARHICGKVYVFSGRYSGNAHRTRQAVYKDIRRAAVLFRVKEHISPHSIRKGYAVRKYAETGSLGKVQKLLNHDSEAVTMLYAMADEIDSRKAGKSHG